MSEAEPVWAKYWDELWELLTPLYDAGWAMPEDDTTSSKEGQDKHWTLHQRLMRSCMVFQVTYEPYGKRLTFGPGADDTVTDEDGIGEYDMFTEPVTIELHGKTKVARLAEVHEAARRLGLLDPTRVRRPEHNLGGSSNFLALVRWKYLLADIPPSWHLSAYHAADAIHADPTCIAILRWVDYAGSPVLPDPVPMAAALGIAYWGWRNTVVEDWHATLDVVTNDVMAKCNILNTKIALAYTTAEQGVDWPAVITALTDPDRTLPDGRKLAVIFGEGWQPVRAAVAERLTSFERAQRQLGPHTMLRLLSILGSGSYTKRWWGNGWWPDLCEQVIAKFTETETPLPKPYDQRGADTLRTDLVDHPELLPDAVLKARRIGASPKGTEGLGFMQMDEPLHRRVFPRDAE